MKVFIALLDCNFRFGGSVKIECDTFEQITEDEFLVNGAKIHVGNKVDYIEIDGKEIELKYK